MKKLLIGLLMLSSMSTFSNTINHENCRLNGAFYNQDLNMILESKGYVLYSGKLEANTILLKIGSVTDTYDSHPFSVACPAQYEKWAKFTDIATLYRFDGSKYFMISNEETSYKACLQSGGEKKSKRSIKRLLNKLPDCEIK